MTKERRPTRGALYIAAGKPHIAAALRSARSVRKTNPVLPIHLFADLALQNIELDAEVDPFTSWENIVDPHPRSKVDYISKTPFEQTLYLDTDTRVLCDLDDAFDLLSRFDVALAHAHRREITLNKSGRNIQIPEAFPEFNSGVMFYRRNAETAAAFDLWRRKYHSGAADLDQPSLREILWSSSLRVATLPPEYNVRYLKYMLLWSRDEARPKILHLGVYRWGLLYYFRKWRSGLRRSLRRFP